MPVHLDRPGGRLPLARARNAGARAAINLGADLLVFLDVDCIPAPGLIRRYAQCARQDTSARLLCGPVAYLPPAPATGYELNRLAELADAHPVRPCPAEDEVLRGGVDDILGNARIFHERWGWWPMTDWLIAFEQLGLARYDPAEGWVRSGTVQSLPAQATLADRLGRGRVCRCLGPSGSRFGCVSDTAVRTVPQLRR